MLLRRFVVMLVLFFLVVLALAAYQGWLIYQQIQMFSAPQPPIQVAAATAEQKPWETRLPAIGSLTAALGVELTAEVSGTVEQLHFHSGQRVEAGQPLLSMNTAVEQASLKTAQAQAELARLEFNRQQNLFERQSISRSQFDQARSTLQQASAQVEELHAILERKRIVAPFSGRIGISQIDPGDYLSPGTVIATLQNLEDLFVDFFVPEQLYPQLALEQSVLVRVGAYPGEEFKGQIAAINPRVETGSRNLQVRAKVGNPDERLLPGMFADLEVVMPTPEPQIVLPETAITYTLYGNSVYVVKPRQDEAGNELSDEDGQPQLEVERRFVKSGDRRAGEVVILEGLEAGELVITAGQLKLVNGAHVSINNSNPL